MRRRGGIVARAALGLVVFLVPSGCARRPAPVPATASAPALAGSPSHRASSQGWVDTRLYFGLGPADHPEQGISESAWRQFLDREVTPRFPDGLTVLDAYGQWQSKKETAPERLRSKVLVIDYSDSSENRNKIEAIGSAWKKLTGDESVLRVTQPADVSF